MSHEDDKKQLETLEIHDMEVETEVRGGSAAPTAASALGNLSVLSASKLLLSGAARFGTYTYTA